MNIFFGAGRVGKNCLALWTGCGLLVNYIADNNEELWEKQIEGVQVISPSKLTSFSKEANIFITCRDTEPVFYQLRELGIPEYQITRCGTFAAMICVILKIPSIHLPSELPRGVEPSASSVLFGLDNGLTLGGVESWSLDTAGELRKLGWQADLLLNKETQAALSEPDNEHMVKAFFSENMHEWGKLSHIAALMLPYRNVVCNFPFLVYVYNLTAACLIKKLFPTQRHIIAVVHNDEEVYYQSYVEMEPYIDTCLVISSKIRSEMVRRGFPESKLVDLPWRIPCGEVLTHRYSQENEPLCIGYAGRIVVHQKRVDNLIVVAERLKQRGLNFKMELAGAGDDEGQLYLQIQKAGLQNEVCCIGMQADLNSFWSRQDIMITCSEFEGHSISQCEAMAAGAVPVITDTSGARDDVEDGKNGFVVQIGDIDQMIEKICLLYSCRERLPVLGKCAHETIVRKNREFDFQKLWDRILLP